jgi:hypothetical protein
MDKLRELEKELFKGGVTVKYGDRVPYDVMAEAIAELVNCLEGRQVVKVKKESKGSCNEQV